MPVRHIDSVRVQRRQKELEDKWLAKISFMVLEAFMTTGGSSTASNAHDAYS